VWNDAVRSIIHPESTMSDFPADADGDALKRLVASGSDLARPMDVDIDIAAPSEEVAIEIANLAGAAGYRTDVYLDDEIEDVEEAAEPWTCQCSRVMLLTYASILECQDELNAIAKPRGGYVDGWGTFGNV
jgi:hypothetical protein